MLNIPTRDELRTTGNGTLESSRPNSAATALLPSEPNSIEETGLNIGFLADLLLKHIYFTGMLSGQQFSDRVKLPFLNVIDKVLVFLREEEYVEITGSQGGYSERSYEYVITTKGRLKAHEVLERSQYVGPAPVPLQAYLDAVKAQELGEMVIDRATIRRAFEGLVIGDTLLDQIGPAANSARSLFLYGPSGNGKTTIAEGIANMLDGAMLVPYTRRSRRADHQALRSAQPPAGADEAEPGDATLGALRRRGSQGAQGRSLAGLPAPGGRRRRRADCSTQLELIYDPIAKFYEAPFQMKANGGMFLIDDFGRQQCRPQDLLNRWIVPLEKQVDLPDPADRQEDRGAVRPADRLLDQPRSEGSGRRSVPAAYPAQDRGAATRRPDEFREIFRLVCKAKKIPYQR